MRRAVARMPASRRALSHFPILCGQCRVAADLLALMLCLCSLGTAGCTTGRFGAGDAEPLAQADAHGDLGEAALPAQEQQKTEERQEMKDAANGLFGRTIRLARFVPQGSQAPPRDPVAIRQEKYEHAERLFAEKQYAAAEVAFRKLLKTYKDTTIEEDVLFMLAECQFEQRRYPKAQDGYERLLKKYDNTRHLDQVSRRLFRIARIWLADVFPSGEFPEPPGLLRGVVDPSTPLDRHGRALEALTSIRLHDPTGPLADDSVMMTASYYFLREKYEDADFYFRTLRQDYPQSEHQPLAHLLGIRSKIRAYQGADYDGRHLDEAERLTRSTLRQFPELKAEREKLLQTLETVRHQKAERLWNTADYYRRSGHPESARVYLRQLLKDYSDTKWGVMARQAFDEAEEPRVAGTPQSPESVELSEGTTSSQE